MFGELKVRLGNEIIVRRTVRSIFGEQTFAQLRTGFTSTETVGLSITGARDGYLDFHTAPGIFVVVFYLVVVVFFLRGGSFKYRTSPFTRKFDVAIAQRCQHSKAC